MNITCSKRLKKESQTLDKDSDEYVKLSCNQDNLKK